MNKCKVCRVSVLDDSLVCPLCHRVLETGEDMDFMEKYNPYPNIREKDRWIQLISRIYFFVMILASAAVFIVNQALYSGMWWCFIPIAGMLYGYLLLRLAIISDQGYRTKISVPIVFGIAMVAGIDWVTGGAGWSLDYVVPAGILLMDLVILIVMLINLRNWQSYLLFQIAMILASLVMLVLWKCGIVRNPVVTFVALGVSVVMFLGCIIFGERKAKTELHRRFHIR